MVIGRLISMARFSFSVSKVAKSLCLLFIKCQEKHNKNNKICIYIYI